MNLADLIQASVAPSAPPAALVLTDKKEKQQMWQEKQPDRQPGSVSVSQDHDERQEKREKMKKWEEARANRARHFYELAVHGAAPAHWEASRGQSGTAHPQLSEPSVSGAQPEQSHSSVQESSDESVADFKPYNAYTPVSAPVGVKVARDHNTVARDHNTPLSPEELKDEELFDAPPQNAPLFQLPSDPQFTPIHEALERLIDQEHSQITAAKKSSTRKRIKQDFFELKMKLLVQLPPIEQIRYHLPPGMEVDFESKRETSISRSTSTQKRCIQQ